MWTVGNLPQPIRARESFLLSPLGCQKEVLLQLSLGVQQVLLQGLPQVLLHQDLLQGLPQLCLDVLKQDLLLLYLEDSLLL